MQQMLCDVNGMALLSHSLLGRQIGCEGRQEGAVGQGRCRAERCRQWLLDYIRPGQPKHTTKAALRDAAMRELKISKNSFDAAWIAAIEETARHDWYEPLRRQQRTRQ